MSKKKFIKTLLVSGLSVLTMTAAGVSLAACKPETDEEPPIEYTQTWTVSFNLDGGQGSIADQKVEDGAKATKPDTPLKSGYTFDGWVNALDGSPFNFDTAITSDVTLKATWKEADTPSTPATYTVTFNLNGGEGTINAQIINEGETATAPSNPVYSGYKFIGWVDEDDNAFDFNTPITSDVTLKAVWEADTPSTPANHTVTFDTHNIGEVDSVTVDDADAVDEPTAYEKGTQYTIDGSDYVFGGWYTDDTYSTEFNFATSSITEDTTIYGKWSEFVTTSSDHGNAKKAAGLADSAKLTSDFTFGKVTYSSGMYFQSSYSGGGLTGDIVNTQKYALYFELAGDGYISFMARQASADGFIHIYNENGELVENLGNVTSTAATYTSGNLAAGKYYILAKTSDGETNNAIRIGNINFTELVEISDPVSIDITDSGKTDYVVGEKLDSSALVVTLTYKNGKTKVLTSDLYAVSVDDFTASGVYTVTVTHTESGFTDNYTVNVYDVESISLGFNKTVSGLSSSAGNSTYVNQTAQQVYNVGDAFSLDGLTVIAHGALTVDGVKQTYEFLYTPSVSDFENLDTSSVGLKTVTVTAYGQEAQYDIWVVDTSEIDKTAEQINLAVSAKFTDAKYADYLSGKFGIDTFAVGDCFNGIYTFTTIQQALDFLEIANLDPSVKKTIYVDYGVYNEKLEVTTPNVTIEGLDLIKVLASNGDTVPDYSETEALIEWDSLFGLPDESGYIQVTDSTATIAVRDTATGFTIKNVTVSNYWNSVERFNEAFGTGYGEHRALAMLVQADKVTIDGCRLLGYQDTIEFFTGRQYVVNTYISGTTDFIFGTNNTTYFYNCEIHSINTGKTDGGYITAFKGYNKSSADAVTYGAIFDNCTFTADEGVVTAKYKVDENGNYLDADGNITTDPSEYVVEGTGNTAIGRPWGDYAAVMVMNSELGGHISTAAYESQSKNARYVSMSGEPTDATVKFVEYNNTGLGAISQSQAGVTVLTDAAEAAKYANPAIIFGLTNGGVTYADLWTEMLNDITVTVYVDGSTSYEYHCYEDVPTTAEAVLAFLTEQGVSAPNNFEFDKFYTDELHQTEVDFSEPLASGTIIYVGWKAASPEITDNTTITFGTSGNYQTYVDLGKLVVNGTLDDTDRSDNVQVKTQSGVTLQVKAGATVTVVSYNGNYTATVNSVAVDEAIGSTWTYEATEDSVIVLYNAASGSCYFYSITVAYPIIYDTDNTIDLLQFNSTVQSATSEWNGITIDATNGKFAYREANSDIQINSGTKLSFKVAAAATSDNLTINVIDYAGNNANSYFDIAISDGVATLTATGNWYIKAIELVYSDDFGEGEGSEQKVTSPSVISFENLNVGTYYGSSNDTVTENISDIGTLTVSNTDFVTATIVHTTTDKLSVQAATTNVTIDGNAVTLTNRLSTQGESYSTRRAVLLELDTTLNYKITVYAYDGGTESRYVGCYQTKTIPTSTVKLSSCAVETAISDVATPVEININGADGKYVYIGGAASIYIYAIVVEVTSDTTQI